MPSRAFFPLRSSVELFRDPESPEPVARAKQAAVLYDEVYFEDGMIDAKLTAQGSFIQHLHPEDVTEEARRQARIIPEPGTGFELRLGLQEAEDVPAPPEAMHTFLSAPFTAKYAAEWRTSVIDELFKFKPDWATPVYLPDNVLREAGLIDLAAQIENELNTDEVAPDDHIQRDFIVKAFSRDLAVAGSMDATVHITSLFEPLLRSQPTTVTIHEATTGATALGVAVPGVGELPWEAIDEFRDHAASKAARAKLKEIEERVISEEPGDAADFLKKVGPEVTDELFAVVDELQGSLGLDIAEHAKGTVLSLVPLASEIDALIETGKNVHRPARLVRGANEAAASHRVSGGSSPRV